MEQFLELANAWENKKQIDIEDCYAKQIDDISFKPKLRNRVDSVQVIAVSVMTINVAIPCTAFPATNPILYRKITKNLNSHKINITWNKLKIWIYNALHR